MAKRGTALELSVLGLLADMPMHGYELRKRLAEVPGRRLLSFGSLYPCLKSLVREGYVTSDPPVTGGRARIVYELTPTGKDRLSELLAEAGPSAWNDDSFDIRFSLFGRTSSPTRVRILEGRRSRLEEHVDNLRAAASRGVRRMDDYTLELQRHGLESAEREIRWLSDLIDKERLARDATLAPDHRVPSEEDSPQ